VRSKRLILWLVIGGGAAAAAAWLVPSSQSDSSSAARVQTAKADDHPGDSRWTALPKRETIGKPGGELFSPHGWTPPVQAQAQPTREVAAKPVAPPVPYRIAGKVVHEGKAEIVLAKGDAVLTVREGDTLDDGYRVEAIKRDHVVLLYVPLGVREKLPLGSTFIIDEPLADAAPAATPVQQASAPAAPLRPAQLRWDGPERVKAGDAFNVALKVTSGQALRAVPLQLSFDAALLEPLGVRPGGLFAGGLFSYRINPAGSIFVGASGKDAVAADADILVVTFKPLRPGETELKISSMHLQSAAGSAIAHDQPAAFRTAITQ